MSTEEKAVALQAHSGDPDIVEVAKGFQFLLVENREQAKELYRLREYQTKKEALNVCGLLRQALNLLEGTDGREKASDQQAEHGPGRDTGDIKLGDRHIGSSI